MGITRINVEGFKCGGIMTDDLPYARYSDRRLCHVGGDDDHAVT